MNERWLIYGAYGFSGRLIAEEAVARGHQPVLAGRDPQKLAEVAAALGLEARPFALDDGRAVARGLADVGAVMHAAGPFVHTAAPMRNACLLAGAHYLDITGEFPVFEASFAHDEAAQRAGVAIISGVGFDVVPSDCLACYLAAQMPDAHHLEIAIHGLTRMSAGTAKSGLRLARNGLVRRGGALKPYPLGAGTKRARFPDGEQTIMPIPWGDLATAYRSTGIPNITTYMAVPPGAGPIMRVAGPVAGALLSLPPIRTLTAAALTRFVTGPDETLRRTGRSYLWARASDAAGVAREAWLTTLEPYQLTAVMAVRAVERVLAGSHSGALTPAQAFGADFILDAPGTIRHDAL